MKDSVGGKIQRTVREKSGLRWRAGDLEVWGGFAEYLLGLMGTLLACWCFYFASPASTFTALCRAIVGVWLSAGSVRVCTVGGRKRGFCTFCCCCVGEHSFKTHLAKIELLLYFYSFDRNSAGLV